MVGETPESLFDPVRLFTNELQSDGTIESESMEMHCGNMKDRI